MFNDIFKIPHQEKLFLAYYGTPTPDNIVGNFYKSRQKLTALLQAKETEKLKNEKEIVVGFYPSPGIQSRYQCTKSYMETLQERHLFNLA